MLIWGLRLSAEMPPSPADHFKQLVHQAAAALLANCMVPNSQPDWKILKSHPLMCFHLSQLRFCTSEYKVLLAD